MCANVACSAKRFEWLIRLEKCHINAVHLPFICVKSQALRQEGICAPPPMKPLGRRKQKSVVRLDQSQVQRLPHCVRSYYPLPPPAPIPPDCLSVCLCPCFSPWTDWWELTLASIPHVVSAEPILSPLSCLLMPRLCLLLYAHKPNHPAHPFLYICVCVLLFHSLWDELWVS